MENRLITVQDLRGSSPGSTQRTSWASQCDWERHRERIINLYKFQDHTLRRVMQIMQQEQGFVATPKMYKYHLRKWGIQKNLRAKQAHELLQQTRQGDTQASEFSIGGIRVDQERLRNLLKRASKSQRSTAASRAAGTACIGNSSTSPSTRATPSPLPQARLRPPHPQPELEQMLFALRSYVSGSFDAGRWTRTHIPWQDGLVVASHNCGWSAGRLMNSGHVTQAFRLLGVCLDTCKHMLSSETPYFPIGIYALLFEFSKRHEVLTRAIIAFLRELALVVHRSRRHPVYVLFQGMSLMTSEQMRQCAWALSQSYHQALRGELGHDSSSSEQITALNGRGISWIAAYGSAEDLSLELALQENLEDVSSGDTTSFEALEANLRLANFMLDRGRYGEARDLAVQVLSLAEKNGEDAQDAYLLDDCYRILFWISRHEGTTEQTTSAAQKWVNMCTTRLGQSHELTVDALGEVAEYYGDIGNIEEAKKRRSDHESAMNGMCERLERLGLGREDCAPQRRTMLYGRTSQGSELR
ncbi:hypothetical protein N8I77_008292 [Diaporthe amygdali]|uniref:Clr5 domain-containing protein n=1 Tax=Phomopsis amygdali TaxID=1214568 RepID=A0AAD9SF44_PHOAM|nr:hypothetical protein N8I77_008292 [Diaporthe amygdali]